MFEPTNKPKDINFSNYSYIIIDDERFARSLVKNTLSQIGCRDITEASNGEEASDYLKSQHTQRRFRRREQVYTCYSDYRRR